MFTFIVLVNHKTKKVIQSDLRDISIVKVCFSSRPETSLFETWASSFEPLPIKDVAHMSSHLKWTSFTR